MGVGGGAVAGQGSTLRQDNALAKVLGQSLREQLNSGKMRLLLFLSYQEKLFLRTEQEGRRFVQAVFKTILKLGGHAGLKAI